MNMNVTLKNICIFYFVSYMQIEYDSTINTQWSYEDVDYVMGTKGPFTAYLGTAD